MARKLYEDLSSLNLHSVLSAHLNAAITAQQQTELNILGFIQDVGFRFDPDRKTQVARTVEFRYLAGEVSVFGLKFADPFLKVLHTRSIGRRRCGWKGLADGSKKSSQGESADDERCYTT